MISVGFRSVSSGFWLNRFDLLELLEGSGGRCYVDKLILGITLPSTIRYLLFDISSLPYDEFTREFEFDPEMYLLLDLLKRLPLLSDLLSS